MKQKELTQQEKKLINGGNQSSSMGTEISISTDTLLTLSNSYQSGDKQSSHKLEVGKGINIDLGGNLNGMDGN